MSRFNVITSQADLNQKADLLIASGRRHSDRVNEFAIAAMRYFLTNGSGQIEILHKVLHVIHSCRGMEQARFGAYVEAIFPHNYEKPEIANGIGRFSGKKGKGNRSGLKDYPDLVKFEKFIADNPHWGKFGKDLESSDLDNSPLGKLFRAEGNLKKIAAMFEKQGHKDIAQAINVGIIELDKAVKMANADKQRQEEAASVQQEPVIEVPEEAVA